MDPAFDLFLEAIRYSRPLYQLLQTFQSKSSNETPDKANAQGHELLAFQGRLVALEVGMRQLVAMSQNIDHDVKGGILAVCKDFRENPDQAAKQISQTYPEYDSEAAKMLVHYIAENLASFLPIRLSMAASTTVGGPATVTVNKRNG